MNNTSSNLEKILGRIFLILLSTVIAFVVIDRLSIKFLTNRSTIEQQFNVQEIRQPKPYVMFGGAPNGKTPWTIKMKSGEIKTVHLNQLGYRDEAPPMPKNKNEFRIIVLGGSTVFMGNPPIPRLIQYQFEKKGCSEVKVYNFGVVSSVTGMELARIVFEAVDYKPDLIISYSGFNDIDQPFAADPRPGYPYNYLIYENNPLLESNVNTYPLGALWAYGSNLMRYLFPEYFINKFTDIPKLRKETDYLSPKWQDEIASNYINNMMKSQKISNAFGADFMAIFQPSLYFKNTISASEIKHLDDSLRKENSIKIRNLIQIKINTKIEEQAFPFIDMSNLFLNEKETIYIDRVHLQSPYHSVVAEEIFKHIMEYLRKHEGLNVGQECIN